MFSHSFFCVNNKEASVHNAEYALLSMFEPELRTCLIILTRKNREEERNTCLMQNNLLNEANTL